jgi:diaminopimelate epimerase
MEGLGNDFIVVDLRGQPAPAWLDDAALIRALCDRHRGIGADGVLAILDPTSASAEARMRVRNADGSEAEMCGNGLRCVARFLVDRGRGGHGLASPQPVGFLVETGAGLLRCVLHPEPGRLVEIAMGAPRLHRRDIPMAGDPESLCIEEALPPGSLAEDPRLRLTAVSMGNPHAVCFLDGAERKGPLPLQALAGRLGPQIERLPLFPQRANVEFVVADPVAPGEPAAFTVVVWERGCGLTLACGTGACAVAVAAVRTGRAAVGRWLRITLPGGPLEICVLPGERDVLLRGPARSVFRGEIDLAAFATAPAAAAAREP